MKTIIVMLISFKLSAAPLILMEFHTCSSGVGSESEPKMPSTTLEALLCTALGGKKIDLKYCEDIL